MQIQTNTAQLQLFGEQLTESKFKVFHESNPAIYAAFKQFAFQAINACRTRFGAKMIIEQIRWHTMISGNDGFKVNNNFSAYYARLFIKDYPQYSYVFRTKTAKADSE